MDRPPPTREIAASDVSAPEMYLLLRDAITPRPIAWVSTIDVDGRSNLAPYSFFNVCSPDPPILGFSVGGKGRDARGQPVPKDTLTNIRGCFGKLMAEYALTYMLQHERHVISRFHAQQV